MCVIPRPQCDRPRVNRLNAGHRQDRKFALGSSSGASAAPIGVSGVRGHNHNRFFDSLINFQVYARADNSSITIVCCGAVSDCGNLIKTTRLAVPSPARVGHRLTPVRMNRACARSRRHYAPPTPDAPLQQEGSNLIDHVSALADQPLADSMQSL